MKPILALQSFTTPTLSKIAGLLLSMAVTANLSAQTWEGLGIDNDWNTAENWSTGVPANDGSADLVFEDSPRTTSNAGGSWSINKLTFQTVNNAYTLQGGQLTLGSGGIDNNSRSQIHTIDNNLVLGASQSWNLGPRTFDGTTYSPGLAVNGNLDLGSHDLTILGGSAATTHVIAELNGNISGTGSITKTQVGNLILNGDNSFSGGLNITGIGGRVTFARDTAFGTGTVSINQTGSDLFLTATAAVTIANRIEINSSLATTPRRLMISGNSITFTGETVINTGLNLRLGTNINHVLTFDGDITGSGKLWTEAPSGQVGKVVFNGTNTYEGDTFIRSTPIGITVELNGSLEAGGDDVVVEGDNTFTGTGRVSRDIYFRDGGERTPDGVVKLEGDLQFGAIVSVNSTGGSGNATILDGGTLMGAGIIGGQVTVQSGGTLSPGNSTGILTINNDLSLDAGSTTVMEIGGTDTGEFDSVVGIQSLKFGGTLVVVLTDDFQPMVDDVFHLFDFETREGMSEFDAYDFAALSGGKSWDTSLLYSDGIISVIPEPSTYAVMAGVLVLLVVMLKRRRQV